MHTQQHVTIFEKSVCVNMHIHTETCDYAQKLHACAINVRANARVRIRARVRVSARIRVRGELNVS